MDDNNAGMPHASSDDLTSTSALTTPVLLPLPARVLDTLAVVLALLAVTVAVTGGFREWTPLGRISLTSWERPAVFAFVLALVRALVWRQKPLPRRLLEGTRQWWRSAETQAVLPIFISTRLGVLAIGFLAVITIGYAGPTPWRISTNELINLPARFDAGWYLGIASQGYRWTPGGETGQQNIVFFPAYPMLMRYGSLLVGRQIVWAGTLISLASFFGALVYLHRLARRWLDDERAAAGLMFLAAYPFSVFYSATYTESLFLLATVATMYHFGRDELWQAGAWGLLLGLTRPNGCLMSIVLALMLLDRIRRESGAGWRSWPWLRSLDRLAIAATPGLGMIVYSTYIYYLTGDPLQWSKQQIGWGRTYRGLDALVTDRVTYIADRGFYDYATQLSTDMLYAAAVLFIFASIWPVFRRFGLPMAVLLLANLLPPLVNGGLLSMGRMTSVLFPTFLWMGAAVPPAYRTPVVVAFAMMQGLSAAMFFTWRPMF